MYLYTCIYIYAQRRVYIIRKLVGLERATCLSLRTSSSSSDKFAKMVDEQDRLLPIANVGRMMKQILPPSAKISKEAKQTMQECATEFISFVTGEASDKCHKENRKTVNGDDICWALSALGFDNYAEAIVRYLHKYREAERERASQNKAASSSQDEDQSSEDKSGQPAPQTAETPTPVPECSVIKKGDQSPTEPS